MRLFLLLGHHPTLLPYVEEEVLDALDDPVLAEMLRQARDERPRPDVTLERLLALAPKKNEQKLRQPSSRQISSFRKSRTDLGAALLPDPRSRHPARDQRPHAATRELAGSGDAEARLPINQRIRELILLREQIRGLASAPATVIDSPAP